MQVVQPVQVHHCTTLGKTPLGVPLVVQVMHPPANLLLVGR